MLMERFYRLWRVEKLEPADALRQAQRWLRDTTNGEKAEYDKPLPDAGWGIRNAKIGRGCLPLRVDEPPPGMPVPSSIPSIGLPSTLRESEDRPAPFVVPGSTREPRASEGRRTLLKNLQRILHRLAQGEVRSQHHEAVELSQRALGSIIKEHDPTLWAALQVRLANALRQDPLNEPAENLERAISHYRQALEVCTLDAYPEEWAAIQNNLGSVYADRIRGERAENAYSEPSRPLIPI